MTSFAALLAVIMWSECAAWSSPSRGARVGRVKAVEDDDAEFAAALSRAEARTRGDREELEKRARRAARESRRDARTYAPQKPRLAMKDTRVRASQEPMQELKELYDEGSWGAMEEGALVVRLAALLALGVAASYGLTVNFDDMDELVTIPAQDRLFLSIAGGSLLPLYAISRALAKWSYVDGRLRDRTLYFEATGWADGFMAAKPDDVALRDQQARAAQTTPKLAILRKLTLAAGLITAASTAGVVVF